MNLYQEVEEAFTQALKQGAKVPEFITWFFPETEFVALLNCVVDRNRQRFPINTKQIRVRMCGHTITVVRGFDAPNL